MVTTASFRARSRVAVLTVAALLLGLLGVVAASESASAATGTVSGTVTFGGSGVATVDVSLRGAGNEDLGGGQTEANGTYTLVNVQPGTYTLYFRPSTDSTLARQYLGGGSTYAGAVSFTVGDGQAVTGKNVTLVQGATISGNVKNLSAVNLGDAHVELYDSEGTYIDDTFTDSSGNFSFNRLQTGSVTFRVIADGSYAPEWWNNKTTRAQATYLSIVAGTTTANLNVVLGAASTISGNVKNDLGQNLEYTTVWAYQDGEFVNSSQYTGDDGNFVIDGLAAGTYTLYYNAYAPYSAISEFWDSKPTLATADTFVVGAGQAVTGKDAVLVTGGQIIGYATDDNGAPLIGITVVVYRDGGVEGPDTLVTTTTTTNPGYYFVNKLPAGNYKIGFTDNPAGYLSDGKLAPGTSYVSGWHTTGTSYATATPVVVSAGGSANDTNVTLQHLTFADVTDPASTFFEPIEWMYNSGISTGTVQPTGLPLYKPVAAVSRQAMASFLYKLSGADFVAPSVPSFSDVPTSNPFYEAIEWMKSEGISTGTPVSGGLPLFKPADPVSRQAMATFLSRYKGIALGTPTEQSFADVPISASTAGAIEWMKSAGISTGTPQPSGLPLYKPADPVSRQAMAAFLYRMEHPAA